MELDVEAPRKIMWGPERKRCDDNCTQYVRMRLQERATATFLQWLDNVSVPTHVHTSVFYVLLRSTFAAVTLALQERKTEVIPCRTDDYLILLT